MKKSISLILSLVIVITSCSLAFFAKAQKKEVNINIELLDSILNDRYWVIETLVNGDISNNPYSVINPSSTGENLMDEVLSNYQNDAAFKALVDAMDVYSNTGQYLSGFADDVLSTFEGWFGSSDSADKIVASTAELKYESILNEIIQTDYTSSWGDTLFEENMDLENLKQRSEILKKIDSYQTALTDIVGLNHSESSSIVIYDPSNTKTETFEIDIEDYVGHFLDAYEQDLEGYLNNIVEIPALEGNEALKKKILTTGALGLVTAYERTVIPECNYDLDKIYYDGMFEDTMKIMKGAGKVINIADKAMDYAILLEALQSQKETTVKTMTRISNTTTNEDLAKVLDNYADLVNSTGDEKTLAYETITNYLRNEQTVTNIVQKSIKNQAPKLIKQAANKFAGAKTVVLANSIASAIAIVDLSVWVADQATGIEDTAKKIFVCKYLDKIINEAENVCLDDILAYKKDKTEENAEKVLSDLQFLKELRLYGEKSAYGSMSAQMDSWIGIMLGGGDTKEYLDRRYQASIDTYLGCTFTPVTNNEFSLSSGDVLNISSEDVNGKTYTQAGLKKADGKLLYFAEADLRLMGGIDLNGATVNILEAPNGFYLPLIENDTSGSTINIYCDNVAFGTISNTSDMTIEIKKADKTFQITDSIENSGTLNIVNSLSSSKIPIYDINNSKNINITNCALQCKGTPKNNGTITGMVDICGDGSQSYDNAYFKVGTQAMLGTGTYSDLTFNNNTKYGVSIGGTQTVTDSLTNTKTRIRNGKNIVAIGSCNINDNYYGGATLKNFISTKYSVFNGDMFISGTAEFPNGALFKQGLNLTSSADSLTMADDLNVYGDLKVDSGTINGNGTLNLKGDLNVNSSGSSISNLNFTGLTPQNGYLNYELTVDTLNNSNKSLSGVSFNSKINVTDYLLCSDDTKFLNGNNIVLKGTAALNSDTINGSITADGWTCNRKNLNVKGTFIAKNTVTFSDDSNIDIEILDQTGTLIFGERNIINVDSVKNSAGITLGADTVFNCQNTFKGSGAITNNGTIVFNDDSVISSVTGGIIKTNSDINAGGSVDIIELILESKMPQRFYNSSSTKTETLRIDNTSKSGVSVDSIINVSKEFINNSNRIQNINNIVLSSDANSTHKTLNFEEYNLTGNLTVHSNETLNIDGNLNIKSGAKLNVEDGAKVYVGDDLISSSATIISGKDSLIQVDNYFSSSSDNLTIDGNLIIKSDAKINSSTVNSSGLITFKGDLNVSSGTWNKPNVAFVSKLPQTVSGSTINVNNLIVDNSSKTGITFNSTINYYDTYTNNASVITNESNLVKNS